MIARVAVAATLALLALGGLAPNGWAAIGLWALAWPWLWLFVALERRRDRRGLDVDSAFLLGGAVALLHAGVDAKTIRLGGLPLGIDFLAAAESVLDGGLVTVLCLSALRELRPRAGGEDSPRSRGALTAIFWLVPAAAAVSYLARTAAGFDVARLGLGPEWLAADLLLVWAAWTLARRAFRRDEDDGRDGAAFWLVALGAALSAARAWSRVAAGLGLSEAVLYAGLAAGAAALVGAARRRWPALEEATAGRLAVGALACRAGAVLFVSLALRDESVPGAYALLVDLPSRLLLAAVFLGSRPKV